VIVVYKVTKSNDKVIPTSFPLYFSIYLSHYYTMYPCISCSAVFNSEEERLYHLRYDRCVSVAGQAALSARRNQQQTITDDALAAVMAATEMPINMKIDEDSPVTSENEVAVDDAVVNENVDSEMPEADNACSNEGHDQCESANPDVVRHIPSPDVFRRTIKRDTKSIVKHDICVNGCFMYPVNEPGMKTCPNEECGQARYCSALTEIYVDEDRSEMLIGRSRVLSDVQQRLVTHYRDVFSGSGIQAASCERKIMANTICVVVFVE
ncbi:hypothetical protein EDC96DRAFT_597716, partial [Choanephora cucurbitarum]